MIGDRVSCSSNVVKPISNFNPDWKHLVVYQWRFHPRVRSGQHTPTTQHLTVPSLKISSLSLNRKTAWSATFLRGPSCTLSAFALGPSSSHLGHRSLRVLFVRLWGIEGRDKREAGCQQIGRRYVSLDIIQEWASLKPEPNKMSSRQNDAPTQQIS